MSIEEKYCDNKLTHQTEAIPSVFKSIDLIVKKEGYLTHELYTKKISSEGGSFLGILYEADIKGETADGEKETNIFIKQIIINERFKAVDLTDAYLKESYVYTELFDIYRDLQIQGKVPVKERFNTVKSFYSDADALYLENMSKKGFRTLDRLEVMSLKYAEVCIQQLARFHGLSFVLQKKNPDYFDRKLKPMKSAMLLNAEWNQLAMISAKAAMECLEESQQEKIRKNVPSYLEKYKLYMETDTARCLCHCDYRQTNILMNEIDGELEVLPIDYQLIYYGSPITDFVFFIFNGTDQEFRRKHLTDLKNMYYDTLEQFLKYFDLDVNIVFPRKEFETEYEEKLDFGLVLAVSLMPFFFNSKETITDLSVYDASSITIKVDNIFIERFREIVDDYEQWGYL